MKNIIKFMVFIIFTILIFFIKNITILSTVFLSTLIITKLKKISLKSVLFNFKIFLPFIIATVLINIAFGSIYDGMLIGIRIIICYIITYIYYSTSSVLEISKTIEMLFYPLKYFGVNTNNIGIIITIAICSIPYLKNDIYMKIKAINLKGKTFNISTILIIIKPIMISILIKTNEMEKTLISKAYNE